MAGSFSDGKMLLSLLFLSWTLVNAQKNDGKAGQQPVAAASSYSPTGQMQSGQYSNTRYQAQGPANNYGSSAGYQGSSNSYGSNNGYSGSQSLSGSNDYGSGGYDTRPESYGFSCNGKPAALYGDGNYDCRIFHVCQSDGRGDTLQCPKSTKFNNYLGVCDWEFKIDRTCMPMYQEETYSNANQNQNYQQNGGYGNQQQSMQKYR